MSDRDPTRRPDPPGPALPVRIVRVADDLDPALAASVVGWALASPYSDWVPRPLGPAGDVVAGWLADPDIEGFLLVRGDRTVGYGEIWEDDEEDEGELAHLVVDPTVRRQGLGRELVLALADEVRRRGRAHVVLRVRPDNAVAIGCYRSAGFVRESPEDEAAFNAGQPTAYCWMRQPR